MIKKALLILNLIIINIFFTVYTQAAEVENFSNFNNGLKITLKNKNYLSSSSVKLLISIALENNSIKHSAMGCLYMILPSEGTHQVYYYNGINPGKILIFSLREIGFDNHVKYFKGKFSNSVQHIFIELYKSNENKDESLRSNIRYIDNYGSIESLKLLTAKSLNQYKKDKILADEEIKFTLPIELQDYLQETHKLNNLFNIAF